MYICAYTSRPKKKNILAQDILQRHGPDPEKGANAWKKMEMSVRNSALHITYAIKQKFFGRHYHTRWVRGKSFKKKKLNY